MSADSLRVVFMGTPKFAVPTLAALTDRGHRIVGVYTRPDRRSGRGRRLTAPPVKSFAEGRGLPVFQPDSLRRDAGARSALAATEPDAIVVAAYGLFLPSDTLALPRLGCLNIHPSLLPRHRGPSPVATAILNGDGTTGVSVMLLDEGMDTGPLLAQRETELTEDETANDLTARLFDLGARLLVETLDQWAAGRIAPVAQDDAHATVTRLLRREDGRLDWSQPAAAIGRRIRAFSPWPGTYTTWDDRTLKVVRARPLDIVSRDQPGVVVRLDGAAPGVVCGAGVLELVTVQLEGRRATSAVDFVQGYGGFVGSVLGG